MQDKIAQLLSAILLRCGRLQRQTLLELAYLVDWEYAKATGHGFTGAEYFFRKRGPFSQEIVDVLCNVDLGFGVFRQISPRGRESFIHFLLKSRTVDVAVLPEDVQRTLSEVLRQVDYTDLESVIDYVYDTGPMQRAKQGDRLEFIQ